MMKCLTLIVAASAKRDLADRLRNIPEMEALKESFFTDERDRARIGIWFVTDIQVSGEM